MATDINPMEKLGYQMNSENPAASHGLDLLLAVHARSGFVDSTDLAPIFCQGNMRIEEKMDIQRKVTAHGVTFNNLLYSSNALKALVGQHVKLQFDGPAGDRALVIWGDSVVEVRLWKRCNPSRIELVGDSSADRPPNPRAFE